MYTDSCATCRNFWFTDEIAGSEVEWPIGAWLYFAKTEGQAVKAEGEVQHEPLLKVETEDGSRDPSRAEL